MKKLSPKATGLLLGLTAVLGAVGIPLAVATALPAGTPPAGQVTLTPTTGTSAQLFTLAPPTGAACPGDNTQSYLYHTFITPFGNDPADFVYTPSGTPTGEPAFTNNLANSIGTRSRNLLPGLGDGLMIAQSNQSFASTALFGALTPGVYTVGFACTQPDPVTFEVQTRRFWSAEITIAASPGAGPNNLTYTVGNIPPPPPTTAPPTTAPPTTAPPTTAPPTTAPPTTAPPTTAPPTTAPPTTAPPTTAPPTTAPPTTAPPTTAPPTTTTTTTVPPTTTTTTTTPPTTTPPTTTPPTTTPPTTTPPTTTPPKPVTSYEATCIGGPFRSATDGVLDTVRRVRWMPQLVTFTPEGRRPMLGIVKDSDVVRQGSDRDDDDDHRGRRGSRRDSTCVTDPFTNTRGKTVVIEFRIRFI